MLETIRLVHWNAEEAEERAGRLGSLGYAVDFAPLNPAAVRALRDDRPAAVVIDLSRLPSQGRDVALQIRQVKPLRLTPLVFVGGEPEKVARIRALLPDAVYTTWEQIGPDLQAALAAARDNPPAAVVVPESNFEAYRDVPLVQKLGIKAGLRVGLVAAPPDFRASLGALPDGVEFLIGAGQLCDLVIWFVTSQQVLEAGIGTVRSQVGKGGLWVAWPKKASGVDSDLTQAAVRQIVMAAGLVDYKISSFNATWSGLRFALRSIPPGEK